MWTTKSLFGCVAVAALALAGGPSHAGPPEDFSKGGIAGCYDPHRVKERDRRVMERLGGRPCVVSPAPAAKPLVAAAFGVDDTMGAYIVSNENPAVVAILNCDAQDGRNYALMIGVIKASDRTGIAAKLFGPSGKPTGVIPISTALSTPKGKIAVVIDEYVEAYGASPFQGKTLSFSGGGIARADVGRIKTAQQIEMSVKGLRFTFSGASAAKAMQGLTECR